jgi:ubiquinone/menaquinone biosynthesis C-methylase UbiE
MKILGKDYTPNDFSINQCNKRKSFKRLLRKYMYPVFLLIRDMILERKFHFKKKYKFNRLLLGQRGNDYSSHRRNLNKYKKIKNSVLLIIGCGHGQDLESWMQYKPKKIIAIDFLNYGKAWDVRRRYFLQKYNIEVDFYQADAKELIMIKTESVDFVCSDAVYEHLKEFERVIKELTRVLRSRGVMYANFGPLWYSFGGDMVSGGGSLKDGFNHILLNKQKYKKYFENSFDQNDSRRVYFDNDLFSYLKTIEYKSIIEQYNYKCLYTSCIISEKTIKFKAKYPKVYGDLLKKYNEDDLLINSLSFIYEKR